MKKRVLSALLILCMMLTLLPTIAFAADTVAYAVTGGNIYFDPATGEITDCDDTVTEAVIPEEIDGIAVTGIGDSAFLDCWRLTDIVISDGITSIGASAFSWCESLTNVTIGSSVLSIGEEAFYECESLGSIEIPASVTSIGNGAFRFCESLSEITVDSENKDYCSEDGVLFDKEQTTLICYPMNKVEETYLVPESVTAFADYAFYEQDTLEITLSSGIIAVGDCAFYNCAGLSDVVFLEGLSTIGDYSFYGCSISEVDFPRSLTAIGELAFAKGQSFFSWD